MNNPASSTASTIVGLIRERVPNAIAIYLFGSRAADAAHESSDFDIAVLPQEPMAANDRWDLQQELAIALHHAVDLVDLRSASTVMRFQVVSTADLLFESDVTKRAEFEMYTYSMYTRFNVERRQILDDVLNSGRVYG